MTTDYDEIIEISSDIVQKWMVLNNGNPRHWTSYSADKIEQCLKKYGLIPDEAMYRSFNNNTEMLEFGIPSYVQKRIPTRTQRIKQWIIRQLSR